MKQLIFGVLSAAMLMNASAHAAITSTMSFNSTTGIAGITSWPTPYTDTSRANPSQYSVTENNYGGSSLFSMAQSFTASATGILESVDIAITGTAPVSFDIALYAAGANDVTDIGSGTYTPGLGGYSNNLLTNGGNLTWGGYTVQGTTAGVLKFTMTNNDRVPIVAGQSYIFEISSTTNPNGLIWYRNGDNAIQYAGGQAFRQRSPLNGNPARDMAIAVNVLPVPEPASLALLGASMVATLFIRKR